ncbi:MAG: S1C family serine protease, partial [Desulfobacterales bacterium]|nr:S1C family serine protease [Desulfobacterales bacterium]
SGRNFSANRLVLYTGAVVIVITLLHAFALPPLLKFFQSEKKVLVSNADDEAPSEGRPPADSVSTPADAPFRPVSETSFAVRSLSIADIARAHRESIVLVKTRAGVGTGFFLDRSGRIITNKHVLSHPDRAEIKTLRGTVYRIRQILREDPDADLVLAATDAPPEESRPVSLSAVLPEAGEKIVVIGNPLGLEQTVSDGIVSAVRRNPKGVIFLQITAPVSPGNSGGPLFNMRGEVVGVATFQYRAGQNLNFCVAASRIADLHNGTVSSAHDADGPEIQRPQTREVYCYADGRGQVYFVDWRTDMQVSRPDGTLDRVKFEKWVLEQIGGSPHAINPDKEAREDLERNREKLFKSVLPHKSPGETNLTGGEQEWLERRYQLHYVEVYNKWMARRNEAVRQYNAMMSEFERFKQNFRQ